MHQWLHAFISTLDNHHPSHYIFPATEDQKKLGENLKIALQSPTNEQGLFTLHQLVKSILLVQAGYEERHSKWESMVECLIAISALKEDGNFKQPHEITPLFAQLVYLIRGTILYEAMDNVANFNGNAYK